MADRPSAAHAAVFSGGRESPTFNFGKYQVLGEAARGISSPLIFGRVVERLGGDFAERLWADL
ncbi:hypothetical protein [Methylosinus sporium]|uniref:hypothetical protein n=1 Tax=Methylosinus sporium TaxID=428 RepID=UPI00132FC725|nr:hypothetical protein [Methylosinus sporium]